MDTGNQQFRFSTMIQVRFADMDAMGHINNAKYLTYFEHARVEYFRSLFHHGVEDHLDQSFIIAEVTVKFRAPARSGDQLRIMARVSRFSTKSFDFEYRIVNDDTGVLVCEGSSVQVMYDYTRKTAIPITDEFLKRVETFEGNPIPRT